MSAVPSSRDVEQLAAAIGEAAYLDVAHWHLYLNDAKIHTPLAEKLYPLVQENRLSLEALRSILGEMPVVIGGGQRQIPLLDFMPATSVQNLYQALQDYGDRW
jgi:hypothetical protein